MRAPARLRNVLPATLLAVALAVGVLGSLGAPALASNTHPDDAAGAWTGFAFDTCAAPSTRVMDRWLRSSPYLGVGVYIGGAMRACRQPHLTEHWVSRQSGRGWKVLPIWVGPQASCTHYRKRISPRPGPRGMYPAARRQGLRSAHGARAAARALGIDEGATLWYDIEAFAHQRSRHCRRSALRFLSAWTTELNRAGYRSGVYSSVSAAVQALDGAATRGRRGFTLPDHIWFAWANHRPDANLGRRWVRSPRWHRTRRVHQFALNASASYGGARLSIDKNFVSLGRGRLAARPERHRGTRVDFRDYRPVHRGSTGPQARAAQCLLAQRGLYRDEIRSTYGTAAWTATKRFQARHHLRRTGRLNTRTWTALLADGARPVVKRGSSGNAVRRVQRAMSAALPGAVRVSGVYGPRTVAAVRRYQRRLGHTGTGVVAHRTWAALTRGHTVHGRASRHRTQKHSRRV